MKLYEIDKNIEDLMENAVDPDTGEINEKYIYELEALQIERYKKIENIGCFIKNLYADAEALKAEKMALAKRQQIAERKAERLKDYLLISLNGERYKSPRVEVSYRKSSAVECDDIFSVPDEYLRYKEPEIDKAAIKQAIKDGIEVAGCRMVERVSAQIK